MTQPTAATQALAPRAQTLDELTAGSISTPADLAARMRAMDKLAFTLSPVSAVGMIAPNYAITPVVVAIDPSVDAETGRGAEVYFQRSIHKSRKVQREGGGYEPVEVSLNKYALLRILAAAGVNVYEPVWNKDEMQGERYLWVCSIGGDITDFDGRIRRLPAGTGSLDARDGAADIGEWTPEEWARRVAVAEQQRAKTPAKEQWKVKPEPINGWTAERVMQVRRFGRQLAETKAMNRLARNLGVRQTYTIDELKAKPFVILRPMYMPDQNDPAVRQMLTAAALGARHLLYPEATPEQVPQHLDAPVTHAHGEPALEGTLVREPEPAERMQTAAAPQDAEEFGDDPPPVPEAEETYVITKVRIQGKDTPAQRFFVDTAAGITLYTTDLDIARACLAAAKDATPRAIATERILVHDQPYRAIVEMRAGDLKL